ncbi:MAG: hypothetical protein GY716_23355 [bacterium]|nr:hypothetical protein [bacterium]
MRFSTPRRYLAALAGLVLVGLLIVNVASGESHVEIEPCSIVSADSNMDGRPDTSVCECYFREHPMQCCDGTWDCSEDVSEIYID